MAGFSTQPRTPLAPLDLQPAVETLARFTTDPEALATQLALVLGTRPMVTVASIGGLAEVLARVNRPASVVSNWYVRGSHGFPAPFHYTRATPLFDLDMIDIWTSEHPELCGNGRTQTDP